VSSFHKSAFVVHLRQGQPDALAANSDFSDKAESVGSYRQGFGEVDYAMHSLTPWHDSTLS
jgi:hypothetical protein